MNLNFPTKNGGNLKSASIWVNYNNSPTWIELTLVLPPIQSTWGEVTWDQFAQVLALICLDQVLCTVDIASQKRGNYKQCQWLIYKFIHVFTLPLSIQGRCLFPTGVSSFTVQVPLMLYTGMVQNALLRSIWCVQPPTPTHENQPGSSASGCWQHLECLRVSLSQSPVCVLSFEKIQ